MAQRPERRIARIRKKVLVRDIGLQESEKKCPSETSDCKNQKKSARPERRIVRIRKKVPVRNVGL